MGETDNATRHVLVVDDHDLVREVIRSILDEAGIAVSEAGSGSEAIEIYRTRSGQFDCVLLDLSMPKMSGAETLVKLRELRGDLKVIVMSAYEDTGGQYLVDNEGAAAYVQKPFQPDTLVGTIRSVIAR